AAEDAERAPRSEAAKSPRGPERRVCSHPTRGRYWTASFSPESLPGMRRNLVFLGAFLALAAQAVASDWGMGDANSRIAPPSMLRPVSTPAHEISTLAIFVLGVTTAIFVIVSGLLAYSVIRFRSRRPDDGSEPPQIYGSGPVEVAWTAVPVLIVFVLILVTARSIYSVQAVRRPPHALAVRVVGPRDPTPTFLELESADVAHSFWVPRLAGKTDLIPNKTNVTWIDPHSPTDSQAGRRRFDPGRPLSHPRSLLRRCRGTIECPARRATIGAGQREERGLRP